MLVTDTHENTAPAADQNEQGSGTAPDTQEVLKDKSNNIGTLQEISKDLEKVIPSANDYIAPLQEVINTMPEKSREKLEVLTAFDILTVISAGTKKLFASIDIELIKRRLAERLAELEELKSYSAELKPFIEKELKFAQKNHPEIKGITVDDIISDFEYLVFFEYSNEEIEEIQQDLKDDTSPISQNFKLIYKIVDKARKACEKRKQKSLLPQIKAKKITELKYPIDKVNASLWGLISPKEKTPLKAESDEDSKKGKQANIYVLLDFDELDGVKISRQLTSYDKRVFIAVANLKAQGHDTITAWQVYNAMGGVSRPKKDTIEKIIQSIETLSKCRVTIDNTEEAKLYTRYDRVKATFYLLPTEICSGYAKGIIVENAIKVLEIPKLFTFAEQKRQLTTVPLRLFESPISKTEANLLLEDYLFIRIARMKNSPQITRTILLEKIYQKCNITSKMQKSRLPEKIERLLQFYKDESWIKGFTITERSIEIKT